MNQPVATKCPTCRNVGNWLAGKYAPFCSHRCKLIDLGGWLNEQHAIGSPLRPEQLEEYSEEPPEPKQFRPEPDHEDRL